MEIGRGGMGRSESEDLSSNGNHLLRTYQVLGTLLSVLHIMIFLHSNEYTHHFTDEKTGSVRKSHNQNVLADK